MSVASPWSASELQRFVDDGVLMRRGLITLLTPAAGRGTTWSRHARPRPRSVCRSLTGSYAPSL